jgi:membrane associated rhomboid family serine protease
MSACLLAIYGIAWVVGGPSANARVFNDGRLALDRFLAGEWWRFVTSELVHKDWEHVHGNVIWLLVVGLAVESRLGTARTAATYAFGAVSSGIAGLAFCSGSGGSSGAIYALLGALLARPVWRNDKGALTLDLAWPVAVYWVFDNLPVDPILNGDIAYEAHVAGLVAGLWCGGLFAEPGACAWKRRPLPWRVSALACATAGLVVAVAPDPVWIMGWNRNATIRAMHRHDYAAEAKSWAVIEALGDPGHMRDAMYLANAARFKLRMHDPLGARQLLAEVAPTLDDAKVYRDLGFLLVENDPTDVRAAVRNWKRAVALNSSMPEVFDALAMAIVAVHDSTEGRPEDALTLAKRAVAMDGGHTPEFLRTLAWAHYRCGHTDEAVIWMRRSIAMRPKAIDVYASELAEFESVRR